jgi:alanyl-tRNA synthetase
MLIGDGVTPGNEGRGYVLRRMMRRTTRNMKLLGAEDRNMSELVKASIEAMGAQYPELESDSGRILKVAEAEEESFLQTLKSGTMIFDQRSAALKKSGAKVLSGEDVFQLHDTYGFPFDLTLEMANEEGLGIDADGFTRLMKQQRERAKADAKSKKSGHTDLTEYRKIAESAAKLEFVGYESQESESKILGFLVDGRGVKTVSAGDEVEILLDRTPFYAEGGGQLADSGLITTRDGSVIEVEDVQSPIPGISVHRGRVLSGQLKQGENVLAKIDVDRRKAISRAHTATHMVHKAFREILGETATQAGSENAPGRFRFDFPSSGAVSEAILNEVEARVNSLLLENLRVSAEEMSQSEAKKIGAMALFGEKYGERVRVISVGEWAKELCGGTHVSRSGELGLVKLLGESSIGAGVRRVEALVGADAYSFLSREHILINSLLEIIKATRAEELPERISALLLRLKEAEKEIGSMRSAKALSDSASLIKSAEDIGKFKFIGTDMGKGFSGDDLRTVALDLRNRLKGSVVALASSGEEKVTLVVAVEEIARSSGVKAGALVKIASGILGGGGGGKDDFAQGGGSEFGKIDEALKAIKSALTSI